MNWGRNVVDDKTRWLRNETLLQQADYFDCYRKFETIVYGMETKGWKPRIVEVRRSRPRQLILLARGASRTWNSKHLTGRAMDVIDARWEWKLVPVEFMADLFILALRQGLTTGVLFGLEQGYKGNLIILAKDQQPSSRDSLIKMLHWKRGWDPCHCEVP